MSSFRISEVRTRETTIFVRSDGSGRPLLLLHGFPETHLMWRGVAPLLSRHFTVVCADLRGYGASGTPVSTPDHSPYAKRAMAEDMVSVMDHLGFSHFSVAGHDRGGRVACRLALDYPQRIDALAVLDIAPSETAWTRADDRFALAFWPWSLLAQPEPLPERILTSAAQSVVDNACGQWGSPSSAFPSAVRAAYVEALRDPSHAHAICEEYRAAATIDREHDRATRARGQRLSGPVLVLWSAVGPLGRWYDDAGGPVGLWRDWADHVVGHAVDAGHFFPEENPEDCAELLRRFFAACEIPSHRNHPCWP